MLSTIDWREVLETIESIISREITDRSQRMFEPNASIDYEFFKSVRYQIDGMRMAVDIIKDNLYKPEED